MAQAFTIAGATGAEVPRFGTIVKLGHAVVVDQDPLGSVLGMPAVAMNDQLALTNSLYVMTWTAATTDPELPQLVERKPYPPATDPPPTTFK